MNSGKNLVANFLGKFYAAFINLAFVPLYIKFIGVEGYGLVGFYATLQAVFNLLDIGFSSTLKRELACTDESEEGAVRTGDFLFTMQGLYLPLALLSCISTFLVSPLVARYWLNSENLSPEVLGEVVSLFGFVIATRMLYGFYSGGLLGLKKQVLYNWVNSIYVTLRAGGAVIALWLISPSITVFFVWQAMSGLAGVAVIGHLLWVNLPKRSRSAQFKLQMMQEVWRYSAGLSTNSILTMMLSQADKMALSMLLPLEMFGYYALAGTLASSLQYFGAPVYTTYFPVFAKFASQGLGKPLTEQYHKATQVMAIAVLPAAGLFIFMSKSLIIAWTKDITIADNAWVLASLLSFGTAFNLISAMPYNLQLGYKHTRIGVLLNLIALIALLPSLYFGIKYLGPVGAALVMALIYVCHVLLLAFLVHRKFLVGHFARWCFVDIAPSGIAVALVGFVATYAMPPLDSTWLLFAALTLVYVCMLVAATLSADLVRKYVFSVVRGF